MKPTIIADVGSNHRGSLELALKQIDAAKECGADVCKFQLYSDLELYGVPHPEVNRHSINRDWLPQLESYCHNADIELMVTAFSPEGVKAVDPFVKRHKLASSEFLHWEMWDALIETKKEIIASTGGCHFSEVKQVHAYAWDKRAEGIESRIKVLECVANYPANPSDYDLRIFTEGGGTVTRTGYGNGICTEAWHYKGAHGISDHTLTDSLALASIGFGATIFEKHFDGEKDGPDDSFRTPDSPVSLGVHAMTRYCASIREAFSAIGDGIKQPRHQHDALLRYRRRLIVTQDLPVGAKLKSHENYGIYRSLKDDTRGDRTVKLPWYEGKVLKVEKKAGDSLWEADVEI